MPAGFERRMRSLSTIRAWRSRACLAVQLSVATISAKLLPSIQWSWRPLWLACAVRGGVVQCWTEPGSLGRAVREVPTDRHLGRGFALLTRRRAGGAGGQIDVARPAPFE